MANIFGTVWSDNGTVQGGALRPALNGTIFADSIYGYQGNDIEYGNGGNDTLWGHGGSDRQYGGYGNDVIYGDGTNGWYGVDGGDYQDGGYGNDSLYGHDGNDTQYGGYGYDYLNGGNGNDYQYGGYDGDSLYGYAGNDYQYGQYGNDYLNGGTGNDHLWGGANQDGLVGGLNSDTFHFVQGDSNIATPDTIWDWDAVSDSIDMPIAGNGANYVEHSAVPWGVNSIATAAAHANAAHAGDTYVFLYNPGNNTGYLVADLDGNNMFETGVILAGAGAAADLNWLDIV